MMLWTSIGDWKMQWKERNVNKTKCMQLFFGKKGVSKVDPCGVCGERVGCNSIQCTIVCTPC